MSKEFKKLFSTVIITAVSFFILGILAVKVADDNNKVQIVKEYNTNLDYLINSADNYIKVAKPNTLYGIQHNTYTLYIVDSEGVLVREWQYLTD